jgi:hypothetical protein
MILNKLTPMKVVFYTLLSASFLSCQTQSDVTPESDGINPTTAFEIYDSLAPVNGTILKNMQTVRTIYTYNGDYPAVTHQTKESFQYEYDDTKRLIKCVYEADRYPMTAITRLEYNPDGGISKVTMNWYNYENKPGKDMVWVLEKDKTGSKITPTGEYMPFFPPLNPDSDDYKNLVMLSSDNHILQMGGTINGFMNYYSSLTYDSNKNIQKVIFSSVTREGKLAHESALAELEYTKYVRSPFNTHAFALVHHFTRHFGLSPSNELLDFGVNMPIKTYTHEFISEVSPSSRFGHQIRKGANDFHYDFVYQYNAKKLPISAVKRTGYPGMPVQYVDSIRFEYQ